MKKLALIAVIALMMGACQSNNKTEATDTDQNAAADNNKKTTLVAYFSASDAHVTAQVAKTLADRAGAKPERVASVLDTGSCILQGVIPYGAQLLMAVSLAAGAGVKVGALPLIGRLYYQGILLVAVLVAIALPRRSRP